MTYQRREYVLADKLKSEFKERGKDVSGMRASSTSELMRRAAMNGDPRENCAEKAFKENYKKRTAAGVQSNQRKQTSRASTVNNANKTNGNNAQFSARTNSRNANKASANAQNSRRRVSSGMTAAAGASPMTYKPLSGKLKAEVKDTTRKKISPSFVAFLCIGMAMIMIIITQYSKVNEIANDVAGLETKLSQMQTEANELKLQLDEKNDIREIEQIATTKLGMAKEDTMQRRYVTLSDGERIEVIEDAESEENTGGIMLSSIVSAIERFFD